MIKNIALWSLLAIAVGALVAMIEASKSPQGYLPNEYHLVCDVQTKRAYVTFKAWSAHVPNADKFCIDTTEHMTPIVRLM